MEVTLPHMIGWPLALLRWRTRGLSWVSMAL